MNRYLYALQNLIYPTRCLICNEKLDYPEQFTCNQCKECFSFLENICEYCGSPIDKSGTCRVCNSEEFYFTKARSLFTFSNEIQKLIHGLKYDEKTNIGKLFATMIFHYLKKYKPFSNIDILIPVPLHAVKFRSRGFNQSEKITRPLSKIIGIPQRTDIIKRSRFTSTQTQLNKQQRKVNVEGAFTLRKLPPDNNSSVLIIDDVFTTGSTLNAISKLLQNNGVNQIYVLTIARA